MISTTSHAPPHPPYQHNLFLQKNLYNLLIYHFHLHQSRLSDFDKKSVHIWTVNTDHVKIFFLHSLFFLPKQELECIEIELIFKIIEVAILSYLCAT